VRRYEWILARCAVRSSRCRARLFVGDLAVAQMNLGQMNMVRVGFKIRSFKVFRLKKVAYEKSESMSHSRRR
jgi:hypothetical protein